MTSTRPQGSVTPFPTVSAAATTLSVDGAEVAENDKVLIGPLTLAVASAGLTVILGANGAGKSQFLRLVHGLTIPARGTIRWGAQTVGAARAEQSFVFQAAPVMRRSVWANVEFPLIAAGWPRAMRQARTAEALERARLADRAAQPAASLSGGERQRMALARAWTTSPRVLLLDEPCANLDPASTAEFERFLTQIRDEGVKLFLATHDLGQARRLAEDVLFFDRGLLAEQSPAVTFFGGPRTNAARRYLSGDL
ncbi:MAG: ATP-binding cassette domain-containing protein [Pseudomonadota bacterium]